MSNEIFIGGRRLISSKEAGVLHALSHDYISRLCREEKVVGHQIGRTWYVDDENLSAYLVQREVEKKQYAEDLRKQRIQEYHASDAVREQITVSSVATPARAVSPMPSLSQAAVAAPAAAVPAGPVIHAISDLYPASELKQPASTSAREIVPVRAMPSPLTAPMARRSAHVNPAALFPVIVIASFFFSASAYALMNPQVFKTVAAVATHQARAAVARVQSVIDDVALIGSPDSLAAANATLATAATSSAPVANTTSTASTASTAGGAVATTSASGAGALVISDTLVPRPDFTAGTMEVGVPFTVSKTLSVAGESMFTGPVRAGSIIGNALSAGGLSVSGTSRLNNIFASGPAIFSGLLSAGGGITTGGADVNLQGGRIFASNVLNGLKAGTNVTITGPANNPTISVNMPVVYGGGGGGSGTVTRVEAGAGLTGTVTSSGTLALDLSNANTWTALQTFSNGLAITTATSSILKTDADGNVIAAVPGDDYLTKSDINVSQKLADILTDETGTAGSLVFSASPTFSGTSNFVSLAASGTIDIAGLSTLTGGFNAGADSTVSGNFSVSGISTTTYLVLTSAPSTLLKTDETGNLVPAIAGVDYATPAAAAGDGNWTMQFNALTPTTTTRGILVTASSTIGTGGQAGGLTISGGATTTGNQYVAGVLTLGSALTVGNGGTGATTAAGARTNLGLGTLATQNADNVAITGGTVTGVNATTTSLAITAVPSTLLKTNASGTVVPALVGTDYMAPTDLSQYLTLTQWYATTTDALAEGTTNLYFTDTRARAALSSNATGLSYNPAAGNFSLAGGYTIPLTASTTQYDLAYANRINSVSGPLSFTNNTLSIAQASGSQNGYLSSGDWATFNGKLSKNDLAASGPLSYNSTTATFSIAQAGAGQAGYLSSGDWTTFNSKQDALAFTYPLVKSGNTISTAFGTTTDNTYSGTNTFAGNVAFTTATSSILKTTSNGTVVAAVPGVDYIATSTLGSYLSLSQWYATTTDALAEGTSNLYFTNARVRAALFGIGPINFNQTTGAISISQASSTGDGYVSSTDWTNFNDKIASSSLSGASVIAYNPATGVITTQGGTFGSGDYVFPGSLTVTNTATTSNLAIGNVTATLLKTNALGQVIPAVAGVDYATPAAASGDGMWMLMTNVFGQSSLSPTTTQNIVITGAGTSTFNGGLEAWRSIATPYFVATSSTATSSFAGNLAVAGNTSLQNATSSNLYVSGVLTLGSALTVGNGGTGATTATGARTNLGLGTLATQNSDTVTITGGTVTGVNATTTNLAVTSVPGSILKTNGSGTVVGALAGTDYVIPSDLNNYLALSAWYSTTTDQLREGTTNQYFTSARARSALSSTATGLTYNTSTGVFSLTSGYAIPLTASTTEYDLAYSNRITSATSPLAIANHQISIQQASGSQDGYLAASDFTTFSNKVSSARTINTLYPLLGGGDLSANRTLSLAFGTTTDNTWSGLNTFNGGLVATNATTTNLAITGITNSYLATDATGRVVATSSISGGSLSGIIGIANGGTATDTQVTNGVNYFDGTHITSGTALTFNGSKLMVNGDFSVSGTATSSNLAITGVTSSLLKTDASGNVIPAIAGTDYLTAANIFAYPFPSNATSTLLAFNGGLTSYASTTIGSGAAAGGLTVSGNATTTGVLAVQGAATSTFAGGINVTSGCLAVNGACLTAGGLGGLSGTGTANQLAYYTSPTTLSSSGNLTFDGSLLTVSNFTTTNATTTNFAITGITDSYLATDATGRVVATSSISGGTISGIVPIAHGGTGTDTQVTNGVNYYDGMHITSGSTLTFDGSTLIAPAFISQASSTIGNGTQAGGLTISGGATTTGVLTVSGTQILGSIAGGASNPTYSFIGNSNTGIGSASNNQVDIYANGSSRLSVTTTGIRTKLNGSAATPAIQLNSATDGIFGTGSGVIGFATGGQEAGRFSSGLFGIGTTSPFTKLGVAGDAYIGGNLTATGTITTALSSGLVKSSAAGVLSVATAGTDYAPATSGSSLLYGNGSGGFSNASVTSATGISFSGGTLALSAIPNSSLANSGITVTAGSGLSGGGSVALGNSTSLTLDLAHANTWTALQQFSSGLTSYASTTIGNGTVTGGLTVSGTATTTNLVLTGLANTILATDASGKVVATSSIATSSILGVIAVNQGGTGTGTQTTNGVTYYNGAQIVSGTSLTFDGSLFTAPSFISQASSTIGNGTAAGGLTVAGTATTTNLAITGVTSAIPITNSIGQVTAYGGSSCTNQFVRSLNGAGVATCATVNLASDVTGVLPVVNGGTGTNTSTGSGSVVLSASPTFTGTALFANTQNSGTLGVTGLSTFTGGFVSQASSTIGNGTTAGGLTVNGTATSTGLAVTGVTGSVLKTNAIGQVVAATAGTDYAPATSGSSVQLGNGAGGFSSYGGSSCTNQFVRSLNGAGIATCASVDLASDVTGTLGAGNGGTGTNNPTAAGVLVGSYAGGGWQQLATSSLGLLTTNVAEGSNQYFTTSRARGVISASTPVNYNSTTGIISLPFASSTADGYLTSTDWSTFNSKLSLGSLSATYPITYNSGTGVFGTAFSTTTNNTYSGTNTFNGASTFNGDVTLANATTSHLAITGIGTGSYIATDGVGNLVSTTTLSAGSISGVVPIVNGGTNQSSQTTNGVNYYDGTHITSGSALTFDSTTLIAPAFISQASSTIGNGAQAGGLTVNGGATTTGNQYIAGSVGIGTNSPTSFKLQVAGNIGPDADSTYNLGSVSNRFSTVYTRNISSVGNSLNIGPSGAGAVNFTTSGSGGTTVTFAQGGNVGIGSTTPYARLGVSGFTTGTPGIVADALSGFSGNLFELKLASSTIFSVNQLGSTTLNQIPSSVLKTNSGGTIVAAVAGNDYAPATSGSSILLGNGAGGFSTYSGTTCVNQFVRSINGAGVATCAQVSLTADVTGTLGVGNGGTGVTSSTGTGSVVLSNSPSLVTPALGTPTSVVLTNGTGLPITTGVSGLGTGVASFLATPTSANLAAAITDETGSGNAVFSASPTLSGTVTGISLLFTASSTIGGGTAATGLTVYGGATTTGNLTVQGTTYGASALFTASSTIGGGTAATGLTVNGTATTTNLAITGVTGAIPVTNSLGQVTAYSGTSCTNQFVRSLNGAGVATCSSVAYTDLASMTSANFASVISDETGSGALVFGTSPTISGATFGGTVNVSGGTTGRFLMTDGSNNIVYSGLSSVLANTLTDETGTGSVVFSANPTFTGTANFVTTSNSGLLSVGGLASFNGNASTTQLSVFSKAYFGGTATTTIDSTGNVSLPSTATLTLPGITNSYLATNGSGTVVSTSSLAAGSISGVLAIANGGTNTNTQTTNGVNYFDGTKITSGSSLTWNGTSFSMTGNAVVTGYGSFSSFVRSNYLNNFNNTVSIIGNASNRTDIYDGGGAIAVSIPSGGNVGIGTTTPWAQFSINPNGVTGPEFAIGSSTATHLIVTNGGFVGIGGTTTPWYVNSANNNLFTVMGSARIVNGAAAGGLQLGGDTNASTLTANTNKLGVIGFPNYALNAQVEGFSFSATNGANTMNFGGRSGGSGTGATQVNFLTNPDTTTTGGSIRMTIMNAGNVGVGTTTPWAQLSVSTSTANYSGQSLFAVADSSNNTIFNVLGNGNVGIGTTSPYAKLSVVGDIVGATVNATSTSATSTIAGGLTVGNGALNYDYSSGITSVQNLQLGALSFDTDAGQVSFADLPVTSNSSAGTVESYTQQIGGTPVFTTYGESDGSGGVKNLRAAVGTTSPFATFAIQNRYGNAETTLFNIASSTASDNSTANSILSVLSNGNVGIGTTTPWGKLSVTGAGTTSGTGFAIADSSNANNLVVYDYGTVDFSKAGLRFGGNSITTPTNGAIYSITGQTLKLGSNSGVDFVNNSASLVAHIDVGGGATYFSTGNVGIGTSTPTRRLEVGSGSGAEFMRVNGGNGTNSGAALIISNNSGDVFDIGNYSSIYGGTYNSTATLYTAGNNLTIPSGNVGVGTAAPAYKLEVQGSLGITDHANSGDATYDALLSHAVSSPYDILNVDSKGGTGGWSGSIDFRTSTNAGALTSRLRINGDTGNVGIGTTSPISLLSVAKDQAIGSDDTTITSLKVSNFNATGIASLVFNNGFFTGGHGGGLQWNNTSPSQNLFLYTNTTDNLNLGVGGAVKMTINGSTGNVGIGTTTPWRALSVNGTVGMQGLTAGSGTSLCLSATYELVTCSSGSGTVTSVSGSGGTTGLTLTGGPITTSGTLTLGGTLAVANGGTGVTSSTGSGSVVLSASPTLTGTLTAAAANFSGAVSTGNLNVGTNYISFGGNVTTDATQGLYWHTPGSGNSYGIYRTSGTWSASNYQQLKVDFPTGIILDPGVSFGKSYVDIPEGGLRVDAGGVGIGTSTPYTKLAVTDAVSTAQAAIAYDGTRYTSLLTDASGDLTITPSGQDIYEPDGNLWVCQSGCPGGTPSGTGNLLVENKVGIGTATPGASTKLNVAGMGLFTGGSVNPGDGTSAGVEIGYGNGGDYGFIQAVQTSVAWKNLILQSGGGSVGIGTTTPTQQLSVANQIYVGAGGTMGMGTATSTFQGDIKIIGKLDVGTIDPPYTIDGIKYATYGESMTGVHEETTATVELTQKDATGKYAYTIDFDKQAKGSDLWLFYQITDFGAQWQDLVVLLTPSFDGRAFYQKVPGKHELVVYADQPGEVSMRLTGNRYDFSKWPNVRADQDGNTAGTHVITSKPAADTTLVPVSSATSEAQAAAAAGLTGLLIGN